MNKRILAFNPELARNISNELSPQRLLILPVLIFLLTGIYNNYVSNHRDYEVLQFSQNLFYIITMIWGCKNISDSVTEEYNSGTWDWQRMSTLSPWKMAIGKLFGSTIYNWYGGFFCLLIYVFSLLSNRVGFSNLVFSCLGLIINTIYVHSIALILVLMNVRRAGERGKIKSTSWILLLPFILWSMNSKFSIHYLIRNFLVDANDHPSTFWYSSSMGTAGYFLLSLVLPAWALIGVYRNMRTELQFKNGIGYWLFFLLTLFLYFGGFIEYFEINSAERINILLIIASIISISLTYLLILFEPIDIMNYRRMHQSLTTKNFKQLNTQVPLWFVTFFVLVIVLFLQSIVDTFTPSLEVKLSLHINMYLSYLFYILRDIMIILSIHFTSKRKRANFSVILYLTLVYLIFPLMMHYDGMSIFFTPIKSMDESSTLIIGIFEAMLAFILLRFVWRK